MNKGRGAQLGRAWCASGVFLNPGKATITKVVNASSDFFRPSAIAPDQEHTLDMLVPFAVPEDAARMNPIFLTVNPSSNWVVVCNLPYWDKVDGWKLFKHNLQFCYELQYVAAASKRQVVMCTPDELQASLRNLGGPT